MTDTSDSAPSIAALEASGLPFVLADSLGTVVRVNHTFRQTYGWLDEEIVGEPIGKILPESFRMAHQFGFSRFQATEQSTILAHPLRLNTLCADGRSLISEHFIVAEKQPEGWIFAATLTPLPEGTPVDA
ncbi:MAG: PAS domain S-box protein [Cyanobium sp. M30B3]|nr:MAG: PAS domain S-box protein [Cyanobium sp. M30B3]